MQLMVSKIRRSGNKLLRLSRGPRQLRTRARRLLTAEGNYHIEVYLRIIYQNTPPRHSSSDLLFSTGHQHGQQTVMKRRPSTVLMTERVH